MAQSSAALNALAARLQDAKDLVKIHEQTTGLERGRRFGVDALNRSAVMLAVSAWEGFVEQELVEASKQVAQKSKGPKAIPTAVWRNMIGYLHEQQEWSKPTTSTRAAIWGLAGRGWRAVYADYVTTKAKHLNTPDYEKVKTLYATTLGLRDFTSGWGEKRWSADVYRTKLEELLNLRHLIAHGAIGETTVGKNKATGAIFLVERMSTWTHRVVQEHVRELMKVKDLS